MKKLTSRQQQAIDTKKKVSTAAHALLRITPYEQLKMSTIASHAGVSVGTLYHYYSSKEELFLDGYNDFDRMIHELSESILFSTHIEAIRSVVYAQTCGCNLRGINIMTSLLQIQLSTHSSHVFSQERYFPQYILHHVQQAIQSGELLPAFDAQEITETILRTSRGIIFDCTAKNMLDRIGEITLHDLDIILSHYAPEHRCNYPPVSSVWLNAFAEWFELKMQN